MLRGLILENFKAFGDRQVIPLAPITLVFGANSAGKSSILQSLLMVKQTLDSPNMSTSVVTDGDLISLDGFRGMIYRHQTNLSCGIGAMLDDDLMLIEAGRQQESTEEPKRISLQWSISRVGATGDAVVSGMFLFVGDAQNPILTWTSGSDRDDGYKWVVDRIYKRHDYLLGLFERFKSGLGASNRAISHYIQVLGRSLSLNDNDWSRGASVGSSLSHRDEDTQKAQICADSVFGKKYNFKEYVDIVEYANSLSYMEIDNPFEIGSIRHITEKLDALSEKDVLLAATFGALALAPESHDPSSKVRDYGELPTASSRIPKFVGLAKAASAAFSDAVTNMRYVGPIRELREDVYWDEGSASGTRTRAGENDWIRLVARNPDLNQRLNEWLHKLGIGYSISILRVPNRMGRNMLIPQVVSDSGVSSRVRNVGFGVGQVLPVVVESITAEKQLIAIEQPELHLHPKLQAELGTMFVDSFRKRGNQFIIETHSEHLILRLQNLIRNRHKEPDETKRLNPKDVCVLYISKRENGSHCERLELDEQGNFKNGWPDGFFDQTFQETFAGYFDSLPFEDE